MYQYPKTIRAIHWLIVLLIIVQMTLGLLMEDVHVLFYGHVFTGILIIMLACARIMTRRKLPEVPSCPDGMSEKQWKMAKAGHMSLYAGLLIVPVSGILAALYPKLLGEVHETLVYVFMALIAGHVAMVVKHAYVDKVNLLKRML